jgi:hypothetical protein
MRCRIPALPSASTRPPRQWRPSGHPHAISTRSATSTIDPATTRTDSAATWKDGVNGLSVESLFPGSVTAVPPVFPNDTGHSSKDNHCSDSYEPGHDAEGRTDRSVRLAVRDDRFREVELGETPRPPKKTPVMIADGSSLRHGTRPASRKCIVHQTNGVMIATVTSGASQPPAALLTGLSATLSKATERHNTTIQASKRNRFSAVCPGGGARRRICHSQPVHTANRTAVKATSALVI